MDRYGNTQSTVAEPFSLSSEAFLDRSSWEKIVLAKNAFHYDQDSSHFSPLIRPEIAGSWIRCKNTGVKLDATQLGVEIDSEEYRRTCKRYDFLIKAAKPQMPAIKEQPFHTDYSLSLITRKGVSLLKVGDLKTNFFKFGQTILNESTLGTNAHSLCMRYKATFHIIGPEHYCEPLAEFATIAAPLCNLEGVVVASLLLTLVLPSEPWTKEWQGFFEQLNTAVANIAQITETNARQQKPYSEN